MEVVDDEVGQSVAAGGAAGKHNYHTMGCSAQGDQNSKLVQLMHKNGFPAGNHHRLVVSCACPYILSELDVSVAAKCPRCTDMRDTIRQVAQNTLWAAGGLIVSDPSTYPQFAALLQDGPGSTNHTRLVFDAKRAISEVFVTASTVDGPLSLQKTDQDAKYRH